MFQCFVNFKISGAFSFLASVTRKREMEVWPRPSGVELLAVIDFRFSRYSFCTDGTENTTSHNPLLSRDVTADEDETDSFDACKRGRGHVTCQWWKCVYRAIASQRPSLLAKLFRPSADMSQYRYHDLSSDRHMFVLPMTWHLSLVDLWQLSKFWRRGADFEHSIWPRPPQKQF
jgi:hypothetical protein